METRVISESLLNWKLKCPLVDPIEATPDERCSLALTPWVLRQAFNNKLGTDARRILHNIRGQMIKLWDGDKQEAGFLSRTAAFRLLNLILEYDILHLEQPYNLILSGYTIQGRYALLRKRKGSKQPCVLVIHTYEPDLRHLIAQPPDVISLSRYIHAIVNSGYQDSQVLHYPLFRGTPWYNKYVDIKLAQIYLESAVRTIYAKHPVSGSHCTSCVSKPCLKVFDGQNNTH